MFSTNDLCAGSNRDPVYDAGEHPDFTCAVCQRRLPILTISLLMPPHRPLHKSDTNRAHEAAARALQGD